MSVPAPRSFAELLQSAVHEPGILSRAYSTFHQYSIGNQVLAWLQCLEREIPPGPLATYPRWKELALLCCAALDLPGVAECRGYLHHWRGQGTPIPERSAQRIFKAADQILKAGTGTADQGVSS